MNPTAWGRRAQSAGGLCAPAGRALLDVLRGQGDANDCQENELITLGIILLIIGFIAKIAILWSIGIVVLLSSLGRGVGGRRHYY